MRLDQLHAARQNKKTLVRRKTLAKQHVTGPVQFSGAPIQNIGNLFSRYSRYDFGLRKTAAYRCGCRHAGDGCRFQSNYSIELSVFSCYTYLKKLVGTVSGTTAKNDKKETRH